MRQQALRHRQHITRRQRRHNLPAKRRTRKAVRAETCENINIAHIGGIPTVRASLPQPRR